MSSATTFSPVTKRCRSPFYVRWSGDIAQLWPDSGGKYIKTTIKVDNTLVIADALAPPELFAIEAAELIVGTIKKCFDGISLEEARKQLRSWTRCGSSGAFEACVDSLLQVERKKGCFCRKCEKWVMRWQVCGIIFWLLLINLDPPAICHSGLRWEREALVFDELGDGRRTCPPKLVTAQLGSQALGSHHQQCLLASRPPFNIRIGCSSGGNSRASHMHRLNSIENMWHYAEELPASDTQGALPVPVYWVSVAYDMMK